MAPTDTMAASFREAAEMEVGLLSFVFDLN
jgi:hypothetical protein